MVCSQFGDNVICVATDEHLPEMVGIYNHAIVAGGQTGDLNPLAVEDRQQWFASHDGLHHRIYVKLAGKRVAGYVALSPYRVGRALFLQTAEISYYVHPDHQGKGYGTALISHALDACAEMRTQCVVAILLSCNSRSVNILKKFDFSLWGTLPGVGRLDGQMVDHLYYGLQLA